jgi:t-SNARE complex subunit (syntaxin)
MDRLKELKKGAAAPEDVAIEIGDADRGLVGGKGGASSSTGSKDTFMQEFFGDVEIVKANLLQIKEATRKIGDISYNVRLATTADREEKFMTELEPTVKKTNAIAGNTKKLLKNMKDGTDEIKKDGAKETPETRIRKNLVSTLTRKFVELMKEYQNVQTECKAEIKNKVKRQVQIVKQDATSEEIDAIFKQPGGAQNLFKTAILSGGADESIQNAFVTAQGKYQDVLTLEASVAELHQMFVDFALLVEQQGELLDQIETQIKEASDYVDAGNSEMVEAIEIQKSIRYKQCCIAAIVLVVIGIIVAVVAAKLSGAF